MTLPVYNLNAPLVEPGSGKLLPPWNSFFQQFTQDAQPMTDEIDSAELAAGYIPNTVGTMFIGGAPSSITLTRGSISLVIPTTLNFIPLSIGDMIQVVGAPARFIPQR